MRNLVVRALTVVGCIIAITACGDNNKATSTSIETSNPGTGAPERIEVLRYETTGGCLMMGPNCATYVVYSDGTVEIYRSGESAPAEIVGSIPEAEVSAFLDSVNDTDFDALTAEVGPGTCNSCVDGVDITLTLTLPAGPTELDSTLVNFDLSNDFFANVETLMVDVRAVGELAIQQRA